MTLWQSIRREGGAGRLLLRIAVVGLVGLSGSELLFRLLSLPSLQYQRNLKEIHVWHPEYHVGLRPNADVWLEHQAGLWVGHFTTNSFGHRGTAEPEVGRGKLLCLGDSIVMGFGVSDGDTFCAQLDGLEWQGESLQAINLGVDAFGTLGYAYRLRQALDQLDSVRLVLLFPSPNDTYMPDSLRARGLLPDDHIDTIRREDPTYNLRFRLQFQLTEYLYTVWALKLAYEQIAIRRIEFANSMREELRSAGLISVAGKRSSTLDYLSRYFFQDGGAAAAPGSSVPGAGGGGGDAAANIEEGLLELADGFCSRALTWQECRVDELSDQELEPLLPLTHEAIDKMIFDTTDYGAELLPILLPVQVDDMLCGVHGRHHRLFQYALQMRLAFRERGVEPLDLRDYLPQLCHDRELLERVANGDPRRLRGADYIIPGDGHLTVAGNEWVARSLRTAILRLDRAAMVESGAER